MARQNRVTPFGKLVASPTRGTLMGNRAAQVFLASGSTRQF